MLHVFAQKVDFHLIAGELERYKVTEPRCIYYLTDIARNGHRLPLRNSI